MKHCGLIFDEKDHAEKMLEEMSFLIKDMNTAELIAMAKYNKYTLQQSKAVNKAVLQSFSEATSKKYVEEYYDGKFNFVIRVAEKHYQRRSVPIPITEKEKIAIANVEDINTKKTIFAMLAIAKYFKTTSNPVKPLPKTEKDDRIFFNNNIRNALDLMRINTNNDEKIAIMYNAQHSGLVNASYKGSYEMLLWDKDGEPDFLIYHMEQLKFYYLKYFEGSNINECQNCKKLYYVAKHWFRNKNKVSTCKDCS